MDMTSQSEGRFERTALRLTFALCFGPGAERLKLAPAFDNGVNDQAV